MSEILNYYKKRKIETHLLTDKYFDIVLARDEGETSNVKYDAELNKNCLSAYIDLQNENCISGDSLYSIEKWINATSEDATMSDVGFTFTDNGRIWFDKYTTSNKDAADIMVNSQYQISENDIDLRLYKVSGITQNFTYPIEISEDGYAKLMGGFYQGCFRYFGFNHEILPSTIENEWNMEFVLRPQSYETPKNTLNELHPENNGIFFYIGTRAENKFAQFYGDIFEQYRVENINSEYCPSFTDGNYSDVPENFTEKEDGVHYLINPNYSFNNPYNCGCPKRNDEDDAQGGETNSGNTCDYYFSDDYALTGDTLTMPSETSDGKPLYDNSYFEITTDNKYLLFNKTKYGFTTENWVEGTDVILTGVTKNYNTNLNNNLFLLMNHSKNGLTTDSVEKLESLGETKKYSLKKDIENNAFALKYNFDGSISYRYLIADCDSDEGFSVVEERSFSGIVKPNEWNVVTVKFKVLNGYVNECNTPSSGRKMKIYIYINGYLKLVSKELPVFDFHELDDTFDKQEGVPFNISLGGGTQGLRESINFKYWEKFPYVLPLEKYFAGTFIGDIRSFKFYTCPMEYRHIKNNYAFELSR